MFCHLLPIQFIGQVQGDDATFAELAVEPSGDHENRPAARRMRVFSKVELLKVCVICLDGVFCQCAHYVMRTACGVFPPQPSSQRPARQRCRSHLAQKKLISRVCQQMKKSNPRLRNFTRKNVRTELKNADDNFNLTLVVCEN